MNRYLLTITLEDMPYDCWRQVIVPGELQLDVLHLLLQHIMGWQNCHLYFFKFGNKQYAQTDNLEDPALLDVSQFTLDQALGKKRPDL